MKNNLLVIILAFALLLIGILSCATAERGRELKIKFANTYGVSLDDDLTASPKTLYKRAQFFAENNEYDLAATDFEALIKLGVKEGAEDMYPKREKAVSLILKTREEYAAVRSLSAGDSAIMRCPIMALKEAMTLLESSMAEAPEGNERAKEFYSSAMILEKKIIREHARSGDPSEGNPPKFNAPALEK